MRLTVVEKEKVRKYSGEFGVGLGPFLPTEVIIYYQCDTGFLLPQIVLFKECPELLARPFSNAHLGLIIKLHVDHLLSLDNMGRFLL